MSFIVYDLVLLMIFLIFVTWFLYTNRKNLKKEGPFFLYKTTWGMKLIDHIGTKYEKTLKFFSYVSVTLGYILMIGMLYLVFQIVYIYLTTSISQIIRAPPIAPLLPYFPKLFGMENFFPPFYFSYFIIAIIIVATVHEFAHGIFMRRYGIKIKSTGFAFFKYCPVFLGAFVEQEEKGMISKSRFKQKSALGAGVLANIITTILFYILLFIFFSLTFAPVGVVFDDYSYSAVGIASISMINGVAVVNPSMERIVELSKDNEFNEIEAGGRKYIGIAGFSRDKTEIGLYDDAPAIKSEMSGAITHLNNNKITSLESLSAELEQYSPGQEIIVKTTNGEEYQEHQIILGENPSEKGKAWLGIGFIDNSREGITGLFFSMVPSYEEPHVYYEANNDVNLFIKDLLWWIVIINLLVAFFNMLPVGFLDGGRFFYLTVLGITKKKKIAEKSFAAITYFLLFVLIVLMIKWVTGFF